MAIGGLDHNWVYLLHRRLMKAHCRSAAARKPTYVHARGVEVDCELNKQTCKSDDCCILMKNMRVLGLVTRLLAGSSLCWASAVAADDVSSASAQALGASQAVEAEVSRGDLAGMESWLSERIVAGLEQTNRRIDIIDQLGSDMERLQSHSHQLQAEVSRGAQHIEALQSELRAASEAMSALRAEVDQLKAHSKATDDSIAKASEALEDTNAHVQKQSQQLSSISSENASFKEQMDLRLAQSLQGIEDNKDYISDLEYMSKIAMLIVAAIIIAVVWAVFAKIRHGNRSLASVEESQASLHNAFTKLQEDSIRIDTEFLQMAQQQLLKLAQHDQQPQADAVGNSQQDNGQHSGSHSGDAAPVLDHNLVLKLANEIARIETNLSKMDPHVKGYKQLVQSKERMINNMKAYGYEIVSLIGQEYNDGMIFETRFVSDPSLPEGKRVITGMLKMLVNYNGQMIQPAQIIVSQNI